MSEKLIGHVGVDAGLIMIGDPCYCEDQKNHPANRDWGEFCDWYQRQAAQGDPRHAKLLYDLGHEGLGVVFDTGIGDGTYPVYATIENIPGWGRRISSVRIDFKEHPLI